MLSTSMNQFINHNRRGRIDSRLRLREKGFPHFQRGRSVRLTELLTDQMIHDVEVGGPSFDASFDSGNTARGAEPTGNAALLYPREKGRRCGR